MAKHHYLISLRRAKPHKTLGSHLDRFAKATTPAKAVCSALKRYTEPGTDVLAVFRWSDSKRAYVTVPGFPTGSGDFISVRKARQKAKCGR